MGIGSWCHYLSYPVRQINRLLFGEIHPNGGGAARGVNHAGQVNALHRRPSLKRSAGWVAGVHLQSNIAWVFQLFMEVAKGIDDDDAFFRGVRHGIDGLKPVDAGRF